MDKFTTETPKKSSIQEQLQIMTGVVESLEAAGVEIIHFQVGKPGDSYVLFYYCDDSFRDWAAENELDVVFEPIESEYHTWLISTTVNGIDVRSYMSDREKENYDGKSV
jgi:hypothetical protein